MIKAVANIKVGIVLLFVIAAAVVVFDKFHNILLFRKEKKKKRKINFAVVGSFVVDWVGSMVQKK